MALTKNITWNSFEVPNAYARIDDFHGFKNSEKTEYKAKLHVNIYKDSSKENCLGATHSFVVTIPYNNASINEKDLYIELKKEEYFNGWTDVLEEGQVS